MTDKKIKIVIADDHRLVRKALISLLEEHPKCKVIAEASQGRELLDLLKETQPDIVLLDIEMPVMNGREALKVMCKRFPEVKVIMLSMHGELTYMSEFISMGARAYVPKGANEDTLLKAIQTVHRDGHYFDQESSKAMLNDLRIEKAISPLLSELALSRREVEILKELCLGKTNKEIADAFKITLTTVSFHRVNIYKKTKSHNITDLIKYSIKNGITDVN